jgi:hypothetical protein
MTSHYYTFSWNGSNWLWSQYPITDSCNPLATGIFGPSGTPSSVPPGWSEVGQIGPYDGHAGSVYGGDANGITGY